jgi:hypothetical protein
MPAVMNDHNRRRADLAAPHCARCEACGPLEKAVRSYS